MDTAVSLVQSYLFANGFFTVTEYPILETLITGESRTVTDIDVLAVRFPGAGDNERYTATSGVVLEPDPELALSDEHIEVIIAEVKEGAAELNKAARDPAVLRAVLARFGAMAPDVAQQVVNELIETGAAMHPSGLVRFRQMVFASLPPTRHHYRYTWISHGHIVEWMRYQVRTHWDKLKTIQSKNPTLSHLILFEKALRGES
jgi:YD repeat-containing protein